MRSTSLFMVAQMCVASLAFGQSSSLLMSRPQRTGPAAASGSRDTLSAGTTNGSATRGAMFATVDPRDEVLPMTRAIEGASLYAIPALTPRKFKAEDLVTIIVRQQKKYEADAEQETKRKWNLSGKVSDWFRFYDDAKHLGQDKMTNGKPGAQFDYKNNFKNEGTNDREDKFTTRVTARVIDVKPNGNLVLEATVEEQHDEETASVTLTGTCRSVDVTADNTVLSTQVADLKIVEKNRGAVRDATTRGWVPRILNFAGGPF
jgi:flagellar L-ring protein precursor FlgH